MSGTSIIAQIFVPLSFLCIAIKSIYDIRSFCLDFLYSLDSSNVFLWLVNHRYLIQ